MSTRQHPDGLGSRRHSFRRSGWPHPFGRAAALIAVCLCLAGGMRVSHALVAEGSGQQSSRTFRTGVDYVSVDVNVTDRQGRFVPGLDLQDFEVIEDGAPQRLSTFAVVDLPRDTAHETTGAGPARPEPDVRSNGPETTGRVYVLVLDDLHVHPLRSARVKSVARQFLERRLGPNDLAAILHTSGRPEASQDFTTSVPLLRQSVEKFIGRKLRSSTLARLEEYGRRRDEPSRADMRLNRAVDPLDRERADHAQRTLTMIASLGDLLSRAGGRRKAVLLISEGIDYPLQPGVTQTSSALTTFTNTDATNVLRAFQEAIRATARANIAIYGIDARGFADAGDDMIEVSEFPENPSRGLTPTTFQAELRRAQDSLRLLSDATGGTASVMSNELAAAFDRIVGDNSQYYLLGYQSTNRRQDGRFRKIEVRVKRPDVQVRGRSGYPATRPGTRLSELVDASHEPSAVLREALNSPLPVARVPLRLFVTPFKGTGGVSVAVGVEIDASRFRFEHKDGTYRDRLEVAVVAIDEKGAFAGGDRQAIDLALRPDTHAAVLAHGLRVFFRLTLPAGRFQLRAAAHEIGTSATGSVFHDLVASDFAQAPLAMSGLTLTTPRAGLMPTAQPDRTFESLLQFPPTGSRRFQPEETLIVFVEVYRGAAARAAAIDLMASVQGLDGRVPFSAAERVPGGNPGEETMRYALGISLAGITPGPYTLRLAAIAADSTKRTVAREIPFEVHASSSAQPSTAGVHW